MTWLRSIIHVLALFFEMLERYRLKKLAEKNDEIRKSIEDDPAGFINQHFNSVLRDAEQADTTNKTDATKPGGDK